MARRITIYVLAVSAWLLAGDVPAARAAGAVCLFDADGDGVCDSFETSCAASNGKRSDRTRRDSDDDFIRDDVEVGGCGACGDPPLDTDGDGIIDACDDDTDGDGYSDRYESGCTAECTHPIDTDGDGIPDFRDRDSDNDGLLDEDEAPGDADGDGVDNVRDPDSDDDGVVDGEDPDPLDPSIPGGDGGGNGGGGGDGSDGSDGYGDDGTGANGATGDLRLTGGGGCSSTPAPASLWLLVLGLVLLRRRRARRAVVPLVLVAAFVPGTANAQHVDVHSLRANMLGEGGVAVPNTDTLPSQTIRVGILGDLAGDALEIRDQNGNRVGSAIDRASAATVGVAVGLPRGFEAQLSIPVSIDQTGAMAASHPAGLRDIGIGAKWGTNVGPVRLAVAPELVLPTGKEESMTTDGAVGARLQVLGDARFGALRVGGAVGARFRAEESRFGNASVGNQVLLGYLADYTLSQRHRVHLLGEVMGGVAVKSSESPAEALGSVQWFVGDWVLVAGGGAGLTRSIGSPEWRALAGVAYKVGRSESRPRIRPAVIVQHAAPVERESPAPEPPAPETPELAPAIASAPADRDGDGIADDVDTCPDEPETANGFDDADGCPDEAPRYVFSKEQPLVLHGIEFATASYRILPASYPILDDVVESIRRQPNLRLRVEGHTDSRGKYSFNLTLSQQRALAIVNYLVAAGVDASRLEFEGFGPTRPIASNQTAEGRQQNRRVEFRVIGLERTAGN